MNNRANTIAGWVLGGGIVALGLTIVTGEYFKGERPEKMGYVVEGDEAEAGAGGAAAEKPFEFYLASADAAKGEQVFKKCAACHNARDWRLWEFDHRRTSFVLDGAHAKTACGACHVAAGATIPRLSGACVDCHKGDDIHHGAFGALCERCHVTRSFKEIRMPGGARRPDADGRSR